MQRLFPIALAAGLCLSSPGSAQQSHDAANAASVAQANAAADRMRHAEDLLEQGDFKAAEPELAVLAKASPNDARVQYDLGFTEEHNGKDDSAANAYMAAIAADATLPDPRIALGLLEARRGHADAAHEQLDAALKLAAVRPALRARALRALARLNEAAHPEEARDQLLEAVQLTGEQPGDADLTARLAARAGDATGAEAGYQRVLSQSPGDIGATVEYAALLQHQGRLAEADSLLTPVLVAHPDDLRLAAQGAVLYAAEDRTPEAIALLQHVRTRDAGAAANPALTRLLAHLELVSGDAVAAEPLYRTLVTAQPGDPLLLDDFGSTLVREQKFAEAQAVFTTAVSLRTAFHDDGAWGEANGHLAFAASRNAQPQVALQALAARATVLPNSAACLFLEATAHDALHQNRLAASSYRAFLAAADGKLPDEEFEARHRLVALEHEH